MQLACLEHITNYAIKLARQLIQERMMNFSQQVLHDIRELHRLEGRAQTPGAKRSWSSSTYKEIEELRKRIPTSILGHYDRLRLRGKESVAPVRRDVCGACHLQIPRGVVLHMQGSHEMGICDHCSAFIYLPEPEAVDWQESPQAKRLPSKRQKTSADPQVNESTPKRTR
ncbi:MAG: hypothetical protein LV480_13040 [Methylacidiphilales bacterium]|nr:hypothetical protein [Candidatus Methylacidiphilales bacterium]